MIAACPKCSTKFRVARERLQAGELRLRCTRCHSVFRVKPPPQAGAPAEPAVDPQPTPAPEPGAPRGLVLVALPESDARKAAAEALRGHGFETLSASDGVEAVLAIQRHLPQAVVLGAALPKMYGFQVCELVKRNESLRSIKVVLVGAVKDQTRYRREPGDLYGADVYLEAPDLPDALAPALRDLGPPAGEGTASRRSAARAPSAPARSPAPPRPAPAASARTAPAPAAPAPAAPAPRGDGLDLERTQAERLARIIVSDVVLYNQEKFSAAVRAGNVEEALDGDLEEGRVLFQSRVDPRICAERDYLRDELLRVARARGMR